MFSLYFRSKNSVTQKNMTKIEAMGNWRMLSSLLKSNYLPKRKSGSCLNFKQFLSADLTCKERQSDYHGQVD